MTKDRQNLHAEKSRTLQREIKEHLRKRERCTVFTEQQLTVVRSPHVPKVIQTLGALPIKISAGFLLETDKLTLKFT